MKSKTLAALVLLLGVTCIRAAAEVFPDHSVDVQLKFDGTTPRARWVAGYLPSYSRAVNGAKPKVWLLDRNGVLVIPETEIWLPGIQHLDIWDATADQSGNLYAALEIWAPDGNGTGAICRVARGAAGMLIIKTEGFHPSRIAVTLSGDIWVFGHPLVLQTVRRTTTEYATLWHFNAEGKLLQTLLPRSAFCSDCIPSHFFGDFGPPQLWASGTHLDLYSATAQKWVELDSRTGQKELEITPPVPVAEDGIKAILGDVAVTEGTNNVYALFTFRSQDKNHLNSIYKLDRKSSRWILCAPPSREYGGLFGSDGKDVVLRAGSKTFGWFPDSRLAPAN